MSGPEVGQDATVDDYRKHLYDALHEAHRDYDQAIITIAGATLALSVTFAHNITPRPIAGTTITLLNAWGLLGLSLIAIIASFLFSQWEIRHLLAALPRANTSWRGGLTILLNLIAGGALVGGLGLLGLYALNNLRPQ